MTTRRKTLKTLGAGAVALSTLPASAHSLQTLERMHISLKGNINHSVCRWCYKDIPFEELCKAAKEIGIRSIELTGPEEWPIQRKYGLHCAMPWRAGLGLEKGFNDPAHHEALYQSYAAHIPKVAEAG